MLGVLFLVLFHNFARASIGVKRSDSNCPFLCALALVDASYEDDYVIVNSLHTHTACQKFSVKYFRERLKIQFAKLKTHENLALYGMS